MRVFIAIEFDQKIKKYLYENQKYLQKQVLSGHFSRPENIHLTLKFLGEINPSEINKIKIAIDKTAKTYKPFELKFSDLGFFNKDGKKIVWRGIENNEGLITLQNLMKELNGYMEEQGYIKEKRTFKPHITLAREVICHKDFKIFNKQIGNYKGKILVDKITLMESKRVTGKLTYIPLYSKSL